MLEGVEAHFNAEKKTINIRNKHQKDQPLHPNSFLLPLAQESGQPSNQRLLVAICHRDRDTAVDWDT